LPRVLIQLSDKWPKWFSDQNLSAKMTEMSQREKKQLRRPWFESALVRNRRAILSPQQRARSRDLQFSGTVDGDTRHVRRWVGAGAEEHANQLHLHSGVLPQRLSLHPAQNVRIVAIAKYKKINRNTGSSFPTAVWLKFRQSRSMSVTHTDNISCSTFSCLVLLSVWVYSFTKKFPNPFWWEWWETILL